MNICPLPEDADSDLATWSREIFAHNLTGEEEKLREEAEVRLGDLDVKMKAAEEDLRAREAMLRLAALELDNKEKEVAAIRAQESAEAQKAEAARTLAQAAQNEAEEKAAAAADKLAVVVKRLADEEERLAAVNARKVVVEKEVGSENDGPDAKLRRMEIAKGKKKQSDESGAEEEGGQISADVTSAAEKKLALLEAEIEQVEVQVREALAFGAPKTGPGSGADGESGTTSAPVPAKGVMQREGGQAGASGALKEKKNTKGPAATGAILTSDAEAAKAIHDLTLKKEAAEAQCAALVAELKANEESRSEWARAQRADQEAQRLYLAEQREKDLAEMQDVWHRKIAAALANLTVLGGEVFRLRSRLRVLEATKNEGAKKVSM
ncbi:hypothetical protein KFL_005130050 [Klebsormidium nitens]|uniref:Uncharacterized protein n=1 Tax=Klebsormidium nitens TaxID=105231 RepID=A0A1Y1IKQ1_KLENI|nr:hypothetical protein KFL_005130050 [Klebsormidium nitens]|eukprot:GAQ89346.1 hypothetical protein KFL_005130050 [Klebsormidium nitens]